MSKSREKKRAKEEGGWGNGYQPRGFDDNLTTRQHGSDLFFFPLKRRKNHRGTESTEGRKRESWDITARELYDEPKNLAAGSCR
jgi:hypothetical protein